MRKHLCKTVLTCAAIATLFVAAGPAKADPVVVNGSFEDVQIGAPYVSSNPADIPGWTHTGAQGDGLLWNIHYSDSGGFVRATGDGNQFVTMGNGFDNGTGAFSYWDQAVTGFTIGQSYNLSFSMAAESEVPTQQLTVDFLTGSSTGAQTFTSSPAGANYWQNWSSRSMTFVATATTVDIRFGANTEFDVGLDAVSVNAAGVPEPSTFALLGLGGVGLTIGAIRRRKAVV